MEAEIMKVKIVEFIDMEGNLKVINKKDEKYTYLDMAHLVALISVNCTGPVTVTLKSGEVKQLRGNK